MQDRVGDRARAPRRGAGVKAGNPHPPDCSVTISVSNRSSSSALILNGRLSPGGFVFMLHLYKHSFAFFIYVSFCVCG